MKSQDRKLVSSMVEGFGLQQWLDAEASLKAHSEPQPKGSLTIEQYAQLRKLSPSRAQTILRLLVKGGKVRCERWIDGNSGQRKVYWLIKK